MDDSNKKDLLQDSASDNASETHTLSEEHTLSEQCAQAEAQLLYLRADFDNYRRNVQKDRALWSSSAQAMLMLDLLPVVDNFERALKDLAASRVELGAESLGEQESARFQGIELIYRELVAFLNRNGVVQMPPGDLFDPSRQEAVVHIEMAGKAPGSIVDVVQKGYLFKDGVLRPAKVVVAK